MVARPPTNSSTELREFGGHLGVAVGAFAAVVVGTPEVVEDIVLVGMGLGIAAVVGLGALVWEAVGEVEQAVVGVVVVVEVAAPAEHPQGDWKVQCFDHHEKLRNGSFPSFVVWPTGHVSMGEL
jgi:hypothetical protein